MLLLFAYIIDISISNLVMESNSSNNVESDKNLKESKESSGDKSQPNDSDVIYFDCKICQNTFTTCKGQENTDPNSVPDICKKL